jgi:hypothetical protein
MRAGGPTFNQRGRVPHRKSRRSINEDHDASAVRKASLRLLPFLGLCYAVNFLDRVNVGFAALSMNADLGFTPGRSSS